MVRAIDTLVIVGAGGDLAGRLLLPGLGRLLAADRGTAFRLVGVDSAAMSDTQWRERLTTAFGPDAGDAARAVIAEARHLQADVTEPDGLRRILDEADGTPALYFAVPPAVTVRACAAMDGMDLPEGIVLCFEKPFGTDRASAAALNRQVARLVPEQQVFRVDHFLGKSTVLNLLGLRFANRVIENVWSAEHVAAVDVVFDETLALEGRAGYYDHAGALVDMIQSHLLLVLALVAMEPPSSLDEGDLRGAIAQALRATHLDGPAATASRRARYTRGRVDEREVPSYVDEAGVTASNDTETLAELRVGVDTWRWAGVPFRLRSGKALGSTRQEIVLTLRPVPHRPTGLHGDPGPARLRIALNPDGVHLDLDINGEGDPFGLDRVVLDAQFAPGELPAYGEVLAGILEGDPTLSVRSDAVEECWRIVESALGSWREGTPPMEEYSAGSSGPEGWRPLESPGSGSGDRLARDRHLRPARR